MQKFARNCQFSIFGPKLWTVRSRLYQGRFSTKSSFCIILQKFKIIRDLKDRHIFAPFQNQNLRMSFLFCTFNTFVVNFLDFARLCVHLINFAFVSSKNSRNFAGIPRNPRYRRRLLHLTPLYADNFKKVQNYLRNCPKSVASIGSCWNYTRSLLRS